MPGGLLPSRRRFLRALHLYQLPLDLLSDEELEERNSLDRPRILNYSLFASEFHWPKDIVDRQPDWYLADLAAWYNTKHEVTEDWLAREKVDEADSDEDPSTRGKSIAEIRREKGLSDDWDDDDVCELIGRPYEE